MPGKRIDWEKDTREKNWNNRRHKTRTNLQNSYGRKVANKNAYINLKSIERATLKKWWNEHKIYSLYQLLPNFNDNNNNSHTIKWCFTKNLYWLLNGLLALVVDVIWFGEKRDFRWCFMLAKRLFERFNVNDDKYNFLPINLIIVSSFVFTLSLFLALSALLSSILPVLFYFHNWIRSLWKLSFYGNVKLIIILDIWFDF